MDTSNIKIYLTTSKKFIFRWHGFFTNVLQNTF